MKCPENPAKAALAPATLSLLVVDADAATAELVRKAAALPSKTPAPSGPHGKATPSSHPTAPAGASNVRLATTLDAAEAEMLRRPADILLVNLQIADQAGAALIGKLKRRYPKTDIIALSRTRRTEACLDAWRAGAADMLFSPLTSEEVRRSLADAAARRMESQRILQRHQRLRTVCRRLNKARHEISQQVDLLCNDLVRAYQEMAQQLNFTQMAAEFAQTLSSELDVESILRRAMEWVLRRLGPVNAAIYLPNGEDHFALGAYLNLDTQADAALIDALGKTIVQQARGSAPLSIDNDQILEELFGEDAEPLAGRQWLAVGCHTSRECLAVLVVFRNRATPGPLADSGVELASSARGLIEAAAPILAERIEQALGFHQRLNPFPDDEPEE